MKAKLPLRKNKARQLLKNQDVFINPRKDVLRLKPRAVQIEISKKTINSTYSYFRIYIMAGALCAVIAAIFGIHAIRTRAEVAQLYPTSCLGGWSDVHNAENKPDLGPKYDPSAFTAENSSILPANTSADLFCGSFTGDVPDDTKPKKIVLTFSWYASSTVDALPPDPEIPIDSTSTPSATSTASSSPDEQGTSTSPVDDTSASSSSTDASSSVSFPGDPVPTPPIQPPDDQASFLNSLLPTAYADSENSPMLDVVYTLDGTNWHELGHLDAAHLRYAKYDIPVDASSTWQDISNLQVGLKSITSIDENPTIYLDGMTLSVSYGKAIEKNFVSGSGLYIGSVESHTEGLGLHIRENDDKQEMVATLPGAPLGGVAVYDASTSALKLTTNEPESEIVLQPEYFGKGEYDIIITDDPNTCAQRSLSDCESDARAEGEFSVTDSNADAVESTSSIVSEDQDNATSTP